MSVVEVFVGWILWPAFTLFFFLIAPVPVLPQLASRLIVFIGKSLALRNISLLLVVGALSLAAFAIEFRVWLQKYGFQRDPEMDVFVHLEDKYAARMIEHGLRWRLERNLYMAALSSVLYFGLHRIAYLIRRIETLKPAEQRFKSD